MSDFSDAFKTMSYALVTRRCALCGEVVELDESLCDECKSAQKIVSPRCMLCGCSKADCNCKKHKNEYKQLAAVYYYKNSIVRAVHNFKDLDMPFLARHFADDILDVINELYGDIAFDCITFVPLRKYKKLKRGYNQSQLIAQSLSQAMNITCMPLLKKVRYTGVQHNKSARQRKADVFGAYDVIGKYKGCLDGKTILLVDDVKTTGSTLNECAKMLNIYGAKEVYAISFALTKKEKHSSD